jgi:prefoldin subunit 5
MSKKDEMEMLKADAEAMNRSLEAVQKRIDELNQETSQQ